MTEDKSKTPAAERRQLEKSEQVRQQAQQSQATPTAQPDRRAVTERRPILHLKVHIDDD